MLLAVNFFPFLSFRVTSPLGDTATTTKQNKNKKNDQQQQQTRSYVLHHAAQKICQGHLFLLGLATHFQEFLSKPVRATLLQMTFYREIYKFPMGSPPPPPPTPLNVCKHVLFVFCTHTTGRGTGGLTVNFLTLQREHLIFQKKNTSHLPLHPQVNTSLKITTKQQETLPLPSR